MTRQLTTAPAHPRSRRTAETGRLEAFSDGVLAIVITLLVLGLDPPEARGAMLAELLEQWPGYLAYLASFAYVAVSWVNHHELFARRTGDRSGPPGLLRLDQRGMARPPTWWLTTEPTSTRWQAEPPTT
jgi:transmembrane protein TMEM174 (potassium channel)